MLLLYDLKTCILLYPIGEVCLAHKRPSNCILRISFGFPRSLINSLFSVQVICQAKVESCSAGSVGWEIQSTAGAYRARCVINCAGLFGDVVDMLGGNANFRYFFTLNGYAFRGSNSTT